MRIFSRFRLAREIEIKIEYEFSVEIYPNLTERVSTMLRTDG